MDELNDRLPAAEQESTFGPERNRADDRDGTVPRNPNSIAVGEFNPSMPKEEGFDWTVQPVSIADLEVGRVWPFQHGKPNLTDQESAAYAELIQAAIDRRSLAPSSLVRSEMAGSAESGSAAAVAGGGWLGSGP